MDKTISPFSLQNMLAGPPPWLVSPGDEALEMHRRVSISLESYRAPSGTVKEKATAGLSEWQKKKIIRYVDGHIDAKLKVSDLSEQVRLSVSRFSKGFNVSFGRPPYDYVLSRRIEAAKYLIASTDEPLSQIAHACGLSDQAHLSKVFKRIVGTTPLKWRKHATVTASTQWDYLSGGARQSQRAVNDQAAAL